MICVPATGIGRARKDTGSCVTKDDVGVRDIGLFMLLLFMFMFMLMPMFIDMDMAFVLR